MKLKTERSARRVYTEAVGCYVSKDVKTGLDSLAKKYETNISTLLRYMIDKAIEEGKL